MEKVQISELRKLLTAVSEHGSNHIKDVKADLDQATFLLNEAAEKLGESFISLDEHFKRQQVALANITESAHDETEFAELQAGISTHIQQVVTNMQFQDMTNQIIERSLRRLNGLNDLLDELSNHGDGENVCMLPDEQQEISAYIKSLNESIHEGSDAINGGLNHRSVNQKNMSTGSVDLF